MIKLDYVRVGQNDFTSQIFAEELTAWQRAQLGLQNDETSVTIYGEFTVDWRSDEPTVQIEYVHAVKGSHSVDLFAEDIDMAALVAEIQPHCDPIAWADEL